MYTEFSAHGHFHFFLTTLFSALENEVGTVTILRINMSVKTFRRCKNVSCQSILRTGSATS